VIAAVLFATPAASQVIGDGDTIRAYGVTGSTGIDSLEAARPLADPRASRGIAVAPTIGMAHHCLLPGRWQLTPSRWAIGQTLPIQALSDRFQLKKVSVPPVRRIWEYCIRCAAGASYPNGNFHSRGNALL
jgi:hypothetical protein